MKFALLSLLENHDPNALVAHGEKPRSRVDLERDVQILREAIWSIEVEKNVHLREMPREIIVVAKDRYLFAVALFAAWSAGYEVILPPNALEATVTNLRQSSYALTVLHDHDIALGRRIDFLLQAGEADFYSRIDQASGVERNWRSSISTLTSTLNGETHGLSLFTSGTTDLATKIPKTIDQLLLEARVLRDHFSVREGQRLHITVPPHHVYGILFGVLLPVVSGASFSREVLLHPSLIAASMTAHNESILISVPAHLRSMELAAASEFPRLEGVFSSGAALPDRTRTQLIDSFGWAITEILGSSETGGIAYRQAAGPYRCLPHVQVEIDEKDRLSVRSPWLHPSEKQPYQTNDAATWVSPDRFEHLGRIDGVVKVGSVRISLGEVEGLALKHPLIDDAYAMSVATEGARGHEVWLLIVPKKGASLEVFEIRSFLAESLEPVAIPRRIRLVPALPRKETGKIEMGTTRKLFED